MARKSKSSSKSLGDSKASKKKATAQPTVYLCPYTNQNVYIGKATLKDLKSKSTYANSSRKRLWTLASPQTRNELYVEAAKAIASREQALLPSFGGRSWEVTCRLAEPHWSGQVLFRAWKGKMELAVLPHLIEKIPEPPTWPGRKSQPDEYEENEEDDEMGLQQREVSSLSTVAWDLRDSYPVPTVTVKWQSPERKFFYSRKAAWEHATAMAAREVEINKCLEGVGASGKLLKSFIPSTTMALKVGKLRFERDGLWVVGQELAWQQGRPQQLEAAAAAEEDRKNSTVPKSGLALFLRSKREEYRQIHQECTTFKQAESELRKVWKTLPRAEQKEWNRKVQGDEAEEVDEEAETMEVEKEEPPQAEPQPEPEPIKFSMSTLAFYVKSRRLEYQQERKAQKWSISLSECDIWLRQEWKNLDPSVKEKWKQKHLEFETKRHEEEVKAEQEMRKVKEASAREVAEKAEVAAEAAAALSSLNRGPGSTVTDLEEVKPIVDAGQVPSPGNIVGNSGSDLIVAPSEMPPDDGPVRSAGAAPTDWQNGANIQSDLSIAEAMATKSTLCAATDEKGETNVTIAASANTPSTKIADEAIKISGDEDKEEEAKPLKSTTTMEGLEHGPEEEKKEDDMAELPYIETSSNIPTAFVACTRLIACPTTEGHPEPSEATKEGNLTPKLAEGDLAGPATVTSSNEAATKRSKHSASRKAWSKKQTLPSKQVSTRWCMTPAQIDLCFAACMDHYDTVMRTVKARDLHRELQDGFDVFRERGHGRYDMELPAFDNPEKFGFLTDTNKAPWMPVVKAILGDDAILIHKGCFLSMPGSAPQEYHQDGVHLTTQAQRPCHAINVFVPLVDLNSRNGPTEFCLGSHILGLEGYDRDFIEVPKPKAGTPVIFDYRLGHRGLGNNSSRSCRPVVYCTYARATQGKEFRDSVNFSRKRYHKIGELSSKPMSREERRNKRKRSLSDREEEELKRALRESTQALTDEKVESGDEASAQQPPPPIEPVDLPQEHPKSHNIETGLGVTNSADTHSPPKPKPPAANIQGMNGTENQSQLHQHAIALAFPAVQKTAVKTGAEQF